MTLNPQAAFAMCLCSHTQRRHEDHEGACLAAGCGCGVFRDADKVASLGERPVVRADPPPAPPGLHTAPEPSEESTGDSGRCEECAAGLAVVDEVVHEALKSIEVSAVHELRLRRIARLLRTLSILLTDLLEPEEIAEPEVPPVPQETTRSNNAYPCRFADCTDVRDTPQGRSMHERRAHGNLQGAIPNSNSRAGRRAGYPSPPELVTNAQLPQASEAIPPGGAR